MNPVPGTASNEPEAEPAGPSRRRRTLRFGAVRWETRVGLVALLSFVTVVSVAIAKRGWLSGKSRPRTVAAGNEKATGKDPAKVKLALASKTAPPRPKPKTAPRTRERGIPPVGAIPPRPLVAAQPTEPPAPAEPVASPPIPLIEGDAPASPEVRQVANRDVSLPPFAAEEPSALSAGPDQAEPAPTEPVAVEPAPTEPVVVEPDPSPTEPVAAEPTPAEPMAVAEAAPPAPTPTPTAPTPTPTAPQPIETLTAAQAEPPTLVENSGPPPAAPLVPTEGPPASPPAMELPPTQEPAAPPPEPPVPVRPAEPLPHFSTPPSVAQAEPAPAPEPAPAAEDRGPADAPGGVPIPNVGVSRPAEKGITLARAVAPARQPTVEIGTRIEPQPHVVQPGENFWTISQRYYRSGRFYKALWKANQDRVPDIRRLYVGTTILVPPPEGLDPALVDPAPSVVVSTPRPRRSTPANPSAEPGLADPATTDEPPPDRLEPLYTTSDRHETLRSVARRTLGDAYRWPEIRKLNLDVLDDSSAYLPVGTELRLPEDARTARR